MDYAELKSAISDWLNRSDMDAVIPTFITLAEASFNRLLRTRQMIVRQSYSIDSQYFDLPADFLELYNIQAGETPLEYRSPELLDEMRSFYSTSETPCYYTMVGEQLEFLPTPASETLELTYYQAIPALSDVTTSNWLLARHPDIYLYGALTQSAPYLKDDQRTALWSQLAQTALETLRQTNEESRTNGHVVRMVSSRTFG